MGASRMNLKGRYIIKYLAFRALPFFGIVCAMVAVLIWATATYGTFSELIAVIVISAITIICHLAYYLYNVIGFSNMIKKQEIHYRTVFNNNGAKTVSIFGSWTICSDSWLILPGKFAIHRLEIKSVSIGESYLQYKTGIIYPVRIKTHSGKTFKLKFNNDTYAKAVRNWARR